jgi:hypothetical protein
MTNPLTHPISRELLGKIIDEVFDGAIEDAMSFFSQNVDRWGAAEWFDRLARAVREQDKAVVANNHLAFDTCKSVAASSAMRLVRDFEPEVRAALSAQPAPADHLVGTMTCPCTTFEQDETCPEGQPSLLCWACEGNGIAPIDKVIALAAEMMKVAEQVDELEDPFAAWESIGLLKTDNDSLRRLFDKQWERTREAGELWRQAHPGNDNVSPDLGDLVAWLMSRAAIATGDQP